MLTGLSLLRHFDLPLDANMAKQITPKAGMFIVQYVYLLLNSVVLFFGIYNHSHTE